MFNQSCVAAEATVMTVPAIRRQNVMKLALEGVQICRVDHHPVENTMSRSRCLGLVDLGK